jgi:S-adenosylmethionine-diacylglycerol 3-amino-3-carboxypropyl transferase
MSHDYFNSLNYTLANEDTTLEMRVLPESARHVLAVAGSGARVLPLLARMPDKVTCVDLSREQLLLTELRFASARSLRREDYLCFWGYPPRLVSPDFRKRVFSDLEISRDCREFFEALFLRSGWNSLLYTGRWETTFAKISKLCQTLLGKDALRIFEAKNFNEHMLFMSREFSQVRWNTLVFLIGNSTFFNALLYKGHFPQKNVPGSHRRYYKDAFNRIFAGGIPRENFFLQLTLLGKILFEEGNPVECESGVYEKIQSGLKNAKVIYRLGNVVDVVSESAVDPIDFVSLSDVPSYFDEKTSRDFLQTMARGLNDGAWVVARYYLRVINWMSREGFIRVNESFAKEIEEEKTQMYHIDIFRKGSA